MIPGANSRSKPPKIPTIFARLYNGRVWFLVTTGEKFDPMPTNELVVTVHAYRQYWRSATNPFETKKEYPGKGYRKVAHLLCVIAAHGTTGSPALVPTTWACFSSGGHAADELERQAKTLETGTPYLAIPRIETRRKSPIHRPLTLRYPEFISEKKFKGWDAMPPTNVDIPRWIGE